MTPATVAATLTVVVIWGFNFVAAKVGVSLIPPLMFTALRFGFVALILAPFFRPQRRQLPKMLLIGSLLGVGHFGVLFLGIRGIDAATAAIANQLSVPFSSLLAAILFADKLGWRRGLGMALAFAGVALLAGEPTQPDPLPLFLVIGASMVWAIANVVIKRSGDLNPLTLNGWMALFAAPQLFALSLIFESGQLAAVEQAGWRGYAALAYTVIGASVIAYSLWYRLIARNDLNQIVPFTLLGPVIGVISGVTLLHEPFTWQKGVGGMMTVVGVAIIQLRELRRRKAVAAPGTAV